MVLLDILKFFMEYKTHDKINLIFILDNCFMKKL